jgi:hypothetical protein
VARFFMAISWRRGVAGERGKRMGDRICCARNVVLVKD